MTARPLLRSEARLAADYLARAEAWVEEVAPELRADIARIRLQLLCPAGSAPEGTLGDRLGPRSFQTGGEDSPGWAMTEEKYTSSV